MLSGTGAATIRPGERQVSFLEQPDGAGRHSRAGTPRCEKGEKLRSGERCGKKFGRKN